MVDKKFEDLTPKEEQAVVWFARKIRSSVREGLDDELRQVPDLHALCEAHRQAMDDRRDYKRKSALVDRILSPEERAERHRLHEESARNRGRG